MRLSFRLFSRTLVGAVLSALVMLSIGAGQASAQQAQALTLSQFLANPNQLLQQFPEGGSQMALLVQQFVIDDASTTPLIARLVAAANPRQKGAIGEGLAQAAKIIVLTDQARAEDVQKLVASLNDPVVNVAFANGLGDVKLGAVGGGPLGGVGAGVGGQTNPLNFTPQSSGGPAPIGGPGVNTPQFFITSSVGGTGGSSITTTNNSVSSTTLP